MYNYPSINLQWDVILKTVLKCGHHVLINVDLRNPESVQRNMSKSIVHNSDLSYQQRCTELEELPLSYCTVDSTCHTVLREYFDLTFLYKSWSEHEDFCTTCMSLQN